MKPFLLTCLMLMSFNALATSGSYLCKFGRYEMDLGLTLTIDRGNSPLSLETDISIVDTDYDITDPSRTVAQGDSTTFFSSFEETVVSQFEGNVRPRTLLIFKNVYLSNLPAQMPVQIRTEIHGEAVSTSMACQKRR